MRDFVTKAYAKINLNLDITGVRDDGYHMVSMVMQQIDLYDWISVRPAREGIELGMSLDGLPTNEKNIAYRAASILMEQYPEQIKGVKLYIHKYIPIAAGMAGGSTDAAAVLTGMNEVFKLGLSEDKLCEIGLGLGADVPFCIKGGSYLAEGIGEKLTKVPSLPDCFLVIAKPNFGISTKDAYQEYDALTDVIHPDMESMLVGLESQDLAKISSAMENVLEQVAVIKHPVISEIISMMKESGAIGARMTGSGPTVFGIFDNESQANSCRQRLLEMRFGKQIFVVRPHLEEG